MKRKYVSLNANQKKILIQNGCSASSWDDLLVTSSFDPHRVVGCRFEGVVKIGSLAGVISPKGVQPRSCGLYHSTFIECEIGDNVFIGSVRDSISHYIIESDVYISDLSSAYTPRGCSFGNGVEVRCVNEGGGREVIIYNNLSAQVAYVVAMYRHRKEAVDGINHLIYKYIDQIIENRGVIGCGAVICNCGIIVGVNIGCGAVVEGALSLKNGSINSTFKSPTYVGSGVICSDFIISEGSCVDNMSHLTRCFVAEGCNINSGFTAIDSLFFAGCDMANGEACSIFAAPYTVSHHKSSLLIAGIFSFFNAGSGTNQSNHLLKMGAVHQGVHERGCKFASNGYVALPSREGAFSLLLGRHYNHHDTQEFPYSYIVEQKGKSYLIPAINLTSFGTVRDLGKWPKRDFRSGARRDFVSFERYNPFIGQKLIQAIKICTQLLQLPQDEVEYSGVIVKKHHLERAVELYTHELLATLATLLKKRENYPSSGSVPHSAWGDIGGLYAPLAAVDEFLSAIEHGVTTTIEEFEEQFRFVAKNYAQYASWWSENSARILPLQGVVIGEIESIIKQGESSKLFLASLATEDGMKDIGEMAQVSYGVDHPEVAYLDFEAVRNL